MAFRRCLGAASVLAAWLVASPAAQQAPPAVAGTQAVGVPDRLSLVGLERLAMSFVSTARVATLDVVVARDGTVQSVRNTSNPPWDKWDQLVEVVRQWRFESRPATTPSSIIVPVTIRFGPPVPTFFDDAAPLVEAPADFALVYTAGRCSFDTRAGTFTHRSLSGDDVVVLPFILGDVERNLIYREMLHVGFFNYRTKIEVDYSRIPEWPVGVTRETRQDGILVTVGIELAEQVTPSMWHEFRVWRQGRESTVGWSDQYIGPAMSREIAGVRRVIGVVQSIMSNHPAVGPMLARRLGCGSLR
jgi:hypothetical protein